MSELIGRNLGPYRIVEQLGMGGMATVYKAYHAAMDRHVAVKVLPRHFAQDPTFVGRFEQEAKVIAKLENARILPVYDYGEEDGITYIVMRYLDAGTLSERIRADEIPLPETARIMSQVAEGLDYAHKKGVIHRDIKPANIMLAQNGDVYLTDFGISKLVEGTAQFTGSGIVGTPDYVSPEQALGQPIDFRSDIYSLGIVLYQMATRDVPFHAETPMAVIIKHIHEPMPMPRSINPNLPESVENVILKALAKTPDDRFQSCGELATALRKAVDGLPVDDLVATKHSDSTSPLKPSGATMGAGTLPMAAAVASASAPTNVPQATGSAPKKKTNLLIPALAVVAAIVLLGGGFLVLRAIQRNRAANEIPTPTTVVGIVEGQETQVFGAAPAAEAVATGLGSGVTEQPGGGRVVVENFDTGDLPPVWQQINIGPNDIQFSDGHVVLAVVPNSRLLELNAAAQIGSPALVVPVPPEADEFSIQVDISFQPLQNFQGAGLVFLAQGPAGQRQVPLFSLMRAYCDNTICGGDAVYLDSLFAFATNSEGYLPGVAGGGTLPLNGGVITLRMSKLHNLIIGEYSIDKQTWHKVGEWPAPAQRIRLAGIVATAGSQDVPLIYATFDNFIIEKLNAP